jgi:hypothetical protein
MVEKFIKWVKEDAPAGLVGFIVILLVLLVVAVLVGGC